MRDCALYEFERAILIPESCPRIFSEIAKPAASSAALTIREPEEIANCACSARACCLPKTRCAPIDATFVLILKPIYPPSSGPILEPLPTPPAHSQNPLADGEIERTSPVGLIKLFSLLYWRPPKPKG